MSLSCSRLVIQGLLVEAHATKLTLTPYLWPSETLSLRGEHLTPLPLAGPARSRFWSVGLHLPLYRLRHDGVPHELLHGAPSLVSAKKRGRWASDNSLRRYGRGGPFSEHIARLSTSQQTQAQLVERNIGGALAGTSLPR